MAVGDDPLDHRGCAADRCDRTGGGDGAGEEASPRAAGGAEAVASPE